MHYLMYALFKYYKKIVIKNIYLTKDPTKMNLPISSWISS